jgi:hypothetical protein
MQAHRLHLRTTHVGDDIRLCLATAGRRHTQHTNSPPVRAAVPPARTRRAYQPSTRRSCGSRRLHPRRLLLDPVHPARPFPSSIFLDKNRRDIGKSQSIWTDSKMETAGSRSSHSSAAATPPRSRNAASDLADDDARSPCHLPPPPPPPPPPPAAAAAAAAVCSPRPLAAACAVAAGGTPAAAQWWHRAALGAAASTCSATEAGWLNAADTKQAHLATPHDENDRPTANVVSHAAEREREREREMIITF